jgi:sodium/hydrogen antiporter
MEWALAIVGLALLGVGAISRRLSGTPATAAMLFVALGLLVGPQVLDGIDVESTSSTVRTLAEATLALVLFSDASRIDLRQLRPDAGVPLRLLGIGLPLTIAFGALAAAVIFDQMTVGEAVILGVILAPTDAALGQAVVTEPRVPARIRQGLNVESGLNDGICVPLLFAAVAAADVESEIAEGRSAGTLLVEEIGYGVIGGVIAGLAIAAIFIYAGNRGLIAGTWRRVIPAAGAALATASRAGSAGRASSRPSSAASSSAPSSGAIRRSSTSSTRRSARPSTASPSCSSGRYFWDPPSSTSAGVSSSTRSSASRSCGCSR